MRIGSLFSGIGGLELGLELAGLGHTVWQVEQSEFCRSVLVRHWPEAERFEDVKEVGADTLAPVDLICGGFPCQDISSAGKGAGLTGSRSGLWFEFARILGELQPPWVLVENVASGANRWVDAVREQLAELGYESLSIPLSAQDVGAPHLRRRIFIVAHANSSRGQTRAKRTGWPKGADSDRSRSRSIMADTQRVELRQQSGRSRGTNGQDTILAGLAGEDGEIADAMRPRLQGPGPGACAGREGSPSDAWSKDSMPKPALCRVDDGPPAWLDRSARLRALGNAVVPQCAEVIGHVIQELIHKCSPRNSPGR